MVEIGGIASQCEKGTKYELIKHGVRSAKSRNIMEFKLRWINEAEEDQVRQRSRWTWCDEAQDFWESEDRIRQGAKAAHNLVANIW